MLAEDWGMDCFGLLFLVPRGLAEGSFLRARAMIQQ
jgi:hypothetical protein